MTSIIIWRVAGALSGVGVRSIAVGLTFTVAVTLEGQVFQMGTTTASARNVPWDNCSSPYQVSLAFSSNSTESRKLFQFFLSATSFISLLENLKGKGRLRSLPWALWCHILHNFLSSLLLLQASYYWTIKSCWGMSNNLTTDNATFWYSQSLAHFNLHLSNCHAIIACCRSMGPCWIAFDYQVWSFSGFPGIGETFWLFCGLYLSRKISYCSTSRAPESKYRKSSRGAWKHHDFCMGKGRGWAIRFGTL